MLHVRANFAEYPHIVSSHQGLYPLTELIHCRHKMSDILIICSNLSKV